MGGRKLACHCQVGDRCHGDVLRALFLEFLASFAVAHQRPPPELRVLVPASVSTKLESFHSWTNPERKRPLGTPSAWLGHRSQAGGEAAIAAGYQRRRGLVPPILPVEMEPGGCNQVSR